VFDNVFPPEKDDEKKRRAEARRQQRYRLDELQLAWKSYLERVQNKTGISLSVTDDNPQQGEYCHLDDPDIPINLYSFLFKTFISTDSNTEEKGHRVAIRDVNGEFTRMENTLLVISAEDYDTIRSLLDVLCIPWVTGTGEAEATASYMCKEGIVDAVLTDDTDVIAYGCPIFLHKINLVEHTCMRIQYETILEITGMTSKQCLDFCILCGTDYNQNLPGIGNERAYKMIKQHGEIERILSHHPHLDPEHVHPFQRVREMFGNPVVHHVNATIFSRANMFCDFPDWEKIETFLVSHDCQNIDWSELRAQFFMNPSIIFPSDPRNTLGKNFNIARQSLLRPGGIKK
jgi:hypothetical protein